MLKISITLPNNAQINLESEDTAVIDRILGIMLLDITRELLVGAPPANPAPARPVPPARESPAVPLRPADGPAAGGRETVAPAEAAADPPPSAGTATPPAETAPTPAAFQPAAIAEVLTLHSGGAGPAEERAGAWPEADAAADGYNRGASSAAGREARDGRDGPAAAQPADNGDNGAGGSDGNDGALPVSTNGFPLAEAEFVDFCRAANPLGDMRRVVVAAEGASRYLGMDGVDAEELGRLFDLAAWPRAHNFVQTLRNAARSKFGWLERVPGRAGYYSVTDLGRATALGR